MEILQLRTVSYIYFTQFNTRVNVLNVLIVLHSTTNVNKLLFNIIPVPKVWCKPTVLSESKRTCLSLIEVNKASAV